MAYSDFTTIKKALDEFHLKLVERSFFPELTEVELPELYQQYLAQTIPVASRGSEKVRSEGIVFPLLMAAKQTLGSPISIFSGEDFTVDSDAGLSGICDFLVCRSPLISVIEAPVIAIVEAKKSDLSIGLGQCIAEMVAAQRINQTDGDSALSVYGVVTTGVLWQYLRLDEQVVTLDLTTYPAEPLNATLSKLVWMLKEGI